MLLCKEFVCLCGCEKSLKQYLLTLKPPPHAHAHTHTHSSFCAKLSKKSASSCEQLDVPSCLRRRSTALCRQGAVFNLLSLGFHEVRTGLDQFAASHVASEEACDDFCCVFTQRNYLPRMTHFSSKSFRTSDLVTEELIEPGVKSQRLK